MAALFDNLANDIFQILNGTNRKILIYDDEGNKVYDPSKARRFFSTNDNILISITKNGADSNVRMYISSEMKINRIRDLIDTLRSLSTRYNVIFNINKYGKEITPKKFASGELLENKRGIFKMNFDNNLSVGTISFSDIKTAQQFNDYVTESYKSSMILRDNNRMFIIEGHDMQKIKEDLGGVEVSFDENPENKTLQYTKLWMANKLKDSDVVIGSEKFNEIAARLSYNLDDIVKGTFNPILKDFDFTPTPDTCEDIIKKMNIFVTDTVKKDFPELAHYVNSLIEKMAEHGQLNSNEMFFMKAISDLMNVRMEERPVFDNIDIIDKWFEKINKESIAANEEIEEVNEISRFQDPDDFFDRDAESTRDEIVDNFDIDDFLNKYEPDMYIEDIGDVDGVKLSENEVIDLISGYLENIVLDETGLTFSMRDDAKNIFNKEVKPYLLSIDYVFDNQSMDESAENPLSFDEYDDVIIKNEVVMNFDVNDFLTVEGFDFGWDVKDRLSLEDKVVVLSEITNKVKKYIHDKIELEAHYDDENIDSDVNDIIVTKVIPFMESYGYTFVEEEIEIIEEDAINDDGSVFEFDIDNDFDGIIGGNIGKDFKKDISAKKVFECDEEQYSGPNDEQRIRDLETKIASNIIHDFDADNLNKLHVLKSDIHRDIEGIGETIEDAVNDFLNKM